MDLPAVLRDRYGVTHADVEVDDERSGSPASATSTTWWVSVDDVRCYVATWTADGAVGSLAAGVQAATLAERSGVATGAAVEALGGDRVLLVDGGSLVLAHHLEGTPVDDPAVAGRVLARVHGATAGHDLALGRRWPAEALDAALALGPLVTGTVHGDPAPEAFLRLDDGRPALVGWEGAMTAPLLHDLAAAVTHLGGPDAAEPLLTAYADADGPATPDLPHLEAVLGLWESVRHGA